MVSSSGLLPPSPLPRGEVVPAAVGLDEDAAAGDAEGVGVGAEVAGGCWAGGCTPPGDPGVPAPSLPPPLELGGAAAEMLAIVPLHAPPAAS